MTRGSATGSWAGTIALAMCLAGIVVGARWAVIDRCGSDLPTMDQWDAEGLHLLSPWFEHRLTLAELFQPHNEHRVVPTKLLNLALALANGEWDQRLECAVNAFLPAAIAVGLFALGARGYGRGFRAALFALLAVAYAAPFGWENLVHGFHSQQFFLTGLSFGAIAWLPFAAPWSGRWWVGAFCAMFAMVSMASGFFAAAVVLVLSVLRIRRRETSLLAAAPALALCAAIVAVGWSTRVTVGYHEPMRAHGAADFALSVGRSLQWPTDGATWMGAAVLLWLPWGWMGWRVAGGPPSLAERDVRRRGCVLAGLGGWVLLQIAATAYARGAGGVAPASRYVDTLVFGAAVNGLAIGWLRASSPSRKATAILGLGWIVVAGVGAGLELRRVAAADLPPLRVEGYYCEQNVRNYLATGDEAYLRHNEIPYPGVGSFVARIGIPSLQAILPASVRRPLALREGGTPVGSAAFLEFDSRTPQDDPDRAAAPGGGGARGISPETPTLSNRITWGSFRAGGAAKAGSWESAPVRSQVGGWLKFEVAGQAGGPGVALELRDPRSRRLLAEVRPDRVPGDSWRTAYVKAPQGEFIVAARDSNPKSWIAFSEPVEMGRLSHVAWRTVRSGRLVAEIAAAAAAILLLTELASGRRCD